MEADHKRQTVLSFSLGTIHLYYLIKDVGSPLTRAGYMPHSQQSARGFVFFAMGRVSLSRTIG